MIVVLAFAYRQDIVRLATPLMGAGVALLFIRLGSGAGIVRFYLLAVWSLIAGVFVTWLTPDFTFAVGSYYLAMGLMTVGGDDA